MSQPETRTCRSCNDVKPLDEFRGRGIGREHVCRICQANASDEPPATLVDIDLDGDRPTLKVRQFIPISASHYRRTEAIYALTQADIDRLRSALFGEYD
jgi:hypothetical protein